MPRDPVAHVTRLRAGVAQALASGRRFGREPASPATDDYVLRARNGGASWAAIAESLNTRMGDGGDRPPQGAPRWSRSSVRAIYLRATRRPRDVQLALPF